MDYTSLWVTARLAAVVTPLLILTAMPLAWIFAFCSFRGKAMLEATCNLPLVLPPTILGFALLIAMGPNSTVGQAWHAITGSRLIFTFEGLVLASMVYSLPFAVQPMKAAFARSDKKMIEAAYMLGTSKLMTFFKVILPNAVSGIAAASVLVFAHTMGEFGVALMVGGSIPGQTKVASISIFEHVESLEYSEATMLSLALIPVSYIVLLCISKLER